MQGIERNTANGSNEMTITTETILCVREVWDALSEATQDADAYGLTMLKAVAQNFDSLCDELINQAGDEGSEVFGMLCTSSAWASWPTFPRIVFGLRQEC